MKKTGIITREGPCWIIARIDGKPLGQADEWGYHAHYDTQAEAIADLPDPDDYDLPAGALTAVAESFICVTVVSVCGTTLIIDDGDYEVCHFNGAAEAREALGRTNLVQVEPGQWVCDNSACETCQAEVKIVSDHIFNAIDFQVEGQQQLPIEGQDDNR